MINPSRQRRDSGKAFSLYLQQPRQSFRLICIPTEDRGNEKNEKKNIEHPTSNSELKIDTIVKNQIFLFNSWGAFDEFFSLSWYIFFKKPPQKPANFKQ
jgi:hypothetical protein